MKKTQESVAANLNIWDQVSVTDKQFAHPRQLPSGKFLHTINPNYQIKRATELFGPCGIGWGYKVIEEKYVRGPLLNTSNPEMGNALSHVVRINFWYLEQGSGRRGEFEHYGETSVIKTDAYGLVFDEGAAKKSLTDAISKCLSMLGFSSDIYSDQFSAEAVVEAPTSPKANFVQEVKLEDTEISKSLTAANTSADLQKVWMNLTKEQRTEKANIAAKDACKKVLSHTVN